MAEFDNRVLEDKERRDVELKPAVAQRILVRALEMGQMGLRPGFELGAGANSFSTVDAEMLIRHGTVVSERKDKEFGSFVYQIRGKVDGRMWELVVALDCEEDYWECPWVTLLSARQCGTSK